MNPSLLLIFVTLISSSLFGTNKAEGMGNALQSKLLTRCYAAFSHRLRQEMMDLSQSDADSIYHEIEYYKGNFYLIDTVEELRLQTTKVLTQVQSKIYRSPNPNLYPVWTAGKKTVDDAIRTLCGCINNNRDILEKFKYENIIRYDFIFQMYWNTLGISDDKEKMRENIESAFNTFSDQFCPILEYTALRAKLEALIQFLIPTSQQAASTSQPAA